MKFEMVDPFALTLSKGFSCAWQASTGSARTVTQCIHRVESIPAHSGRKRYEPQLNCGVPADQVGPFVAPNAATGAGQGKGKGNGFLWVDGLTLHRLTDRIQ